MNIQKVKNSIYKDLEKLDKLLDGKEIIVIIVIFIMLSVSFFIADLIRESKLDRKGAFEAASVFAISRIDDPVSLIKVDFSEIKNNLSVVYFNRKDSTYVVNYTFNTLEKEYKYKWRAVVKFDNKRSYFLKDFKKYKIPIK